jgi:hypothetical protein
VSIPIDNVARARPRGNTTLDGFPDAGRVLS